MPKTNGTKGGAAAAPPSALASTGPEQDMNRVMSKRMKMCSWAVLLLVALLGLFAAARVGNAESAEGPPDLSLSPQEYDFGILNMPLASETHVFTISNKGGSDLAVSAIAVSDSANYSLDMDAGPAPCGSLTPRIAPGGQCTFAVTFFPGAEGVRDTELTIESNDPDTPRLNVTLMGFGILCHC